MIGCCFKQLQHTGILEQSTDIASLSIDINEMKGSLT